jgi:hypothetical protein
MGSIEIPFNIGDRVWWTGRGHHEEFVTCPECLGQKFLTVTQGNGQSFTINCACCSLGYEPPSGVIKRNFYHFEPTEFVCKTIQFYSDDFRYENEYGETTDTKEHLFATKEECQAKCNELNKYHSEDEERRVLANITSKRREVAWSVHYWARKIADLKKELEIAQDRLNVAKTKKK